MKLAHKVAVITGASRGMGRATAILLASEGAKVVVNFHSNQPAADAVVDQIKADGGEATVIQADVSSEQGIKHLFQATLDVYGTVDILVNNAGNVDPQGPLDITWDSVFQTFAANVIGPMFCAKHAAKIMIEQNKSGVIVNISSVRGLEGCGNAGTLAYSAAKAANINFTHSLAKDWDIEKYKIRVNTISPGYTNTDFSHWTEERKAKKAEETVLKRIIDPEEIAQAVLYLTAEETGRSITGETLIIDAGYRLK